MGISVTSLRGKHFFEVSFKFFIISFANFLPRSLPRINMFWDDFGGLSCSAFIGICKNILPNFHMGMC